VELIQRVDCKGTAPAASTLIDPDDELPLRIE
jgi:hypothetical protein